VKGEDCDKELSSPDQKTETADQNGSNEGEKADKEAEDRH
jgi:hypothetical protein